MPAWLLVTPELAERRAERRARIVVDKPHDAMLSLLPRLSHRRRTAPGIHPTRVIGRGVSLGDGVSIGPYVVLGDGVAHRCATRGSMRTS